MFLMLLGFATNIKPVERVERHQLLEKITMAISEPVCSACSALTAEEFDWQQNATDLKKTASRSLTAQILIWLAQLALR